MSAESDLLFPQVDSFLLADFSNLSDYEDFSKDSFLLNEADGFALLEDDLDSKACLKPLLVSELNEFSSSLADIKEEDEEEEEEGEEKTGLDNGCAETLNVKLQDKLQVVPDIGSGMCSMHIENITSKAETLIFTDEISSMSLEDAITQPNIGKSWHTSTFERMPDCSESAITSGESISLLPLPTQADTRLQQSNDACVIGKSGTTQLLHTPERNPRQCNLITTPSNGMHGERRVSVTPPIFHISSPLSSPSSSVSTPDGSSMLKLFSRDENGNMRHSNTSFLVQPATLRDPATLPLQADVYHKAIPYSMIQDGSGTATMHRSRSSHALGQFGSSGHLGTCGEEFGVPSLQVPCVEYSNPNNFSHYQAACSIGLAERSPTTPMRRVFSAGDIQACNGVQLLYGDNNQSRLERVNSEENMGFKVGHYTLEERKQRLHRYRQKRNERNFSKKIKYACRKTLADSRPRIRGRFARTLDDCGEPLTKDHGASYDDEYEEVNTSNLYCNMSNNRAVSFWNATGMHAPLQFRH
ncbi:hypothetical protein L7F22_020342 [Adiantum nelumboides]|nr:hypothetical protein [Adiantum nelumboides]